MSETHGNKAGSLTTEKLLWTYTDLAERTGFTLSTLTKWVSFGKLTAPAVLKFGRTVRFDPEKVMAQIKHLGAAYDS